MKIVLLLILLTVSILAISQSNTLQQHYLQALEAHRNGDYPKFYEEIMHAHTIHPYHQGVLYQAGIAAALNNKKTEAIKYLKEAILIQSDFTLDIPDLNSLKGIKSFEDLKKLQQEASKTTISSDTAFVLKDRSLHLESIAAGEADGIFYGGSIHKRKIIKIQNGIVSDFTKEAQDGLGAVFGIKVDTKKKILWASSSPMAEMKNYNALLPSGVFKYDLRTGKLIKKFIAENPSIELVLGDLAIDKKGEVYVSDSKQNLIFKVNESNGKLEQVFSSNEFWNIQGITFSDDGKFLFIADYIKGLFRLSMNNFSLTPVTKSFDLSLKSVDGVTFYQNSLIAIQNGIKPMRITRYTLNGALDKLESYKIMDQAHPAFNEPTLGCIAGKYFFYVANSQWNGYDQEHKIKPDDQLQDIVILKVKLE